MSTAWIWCRRSLIAVVVLLVVAWGLAAGNQWLLRWRAERLLADIRALEVNKSSLSDAQAFMKKWGKWADGGGCDAGDCRFLFRIENRFPGEVSHWSQRRAYWELHLLDRLGLRPAEIGAMVFVRHDVVTDKLFLVKIYPPEHATWDPHLGESNAIGTLIEEGPRLPPIAVKGHRYPNRLFFPNREGLTVIFTPDEDRTEVARLMDVRFACITSLHHCTSQRELVPAAYDEWEHAKEITADQHESCEMPYWVLARDAKNVLSADVVSAREDPTTTNVEASERYWIVNLRVHEMLKGKAPHTTASTFPIYVSEAKFPVRNGLAFPYASLIVAGSITPEDDAAILGSMLVNADGWRC
jgi:hypothetical protein